MEQNIIPQKSAPPALRFPQRKDGVRKSIVPIAIVARHRNGSTTYYHQGVTPVIVSPSKKQVINLAPEFIKKQDGKTKEDCENAAVKRWLLSNPVERENIQITLLGDELYSRQPICELARFAGVQFYFCCFTIIL